MLKLTSSKADAKSINDQFDKLKKRVDNNANQDKTTLQTFERINKKAQANLAEIRGQVVAETRKAQSALEQEIDTFAKAIGEKILGRAC